MIVVDCNAIAYLVITGDRTELAKPAFHADPYWCAPPLWRSEFLSVLSLYVRTGAFDVEIAVTFLEAAEELVSVLPTPSGIEALVLAKKSGCSSYDCEYVASAQIQSAPLVTEDQKILTAFPSVAQSLSQFVETRPRLDSSPPADQS